MKERRYAKLGTAAQVVVFLLVGGSALIGMYGNQHPWWWAAAIELVALGVLLFRWPKKRRHLYLAAEIALVAHLISLNRILVLFAFMVSAQTMYLLPNLAGVVWIAVLTLSTGALFVYHDGWGSGILAAVVYGTGYISFGSVSYARISSDRARQESDRLLQELQDTHRQLQDHTIHVQELAISEERNRLAREMHDTLGHRLTVAAVQLEGVERLIPIAPDRALRMVHTVRSEVSEALTELRRTVATLRTLPEAELAPALALRRLSDSFGRATGLDVHLIIADETPLLPAAQRLAIYRITQEALTNIQRHAQANQVWVTLSSPGREICLNIEDDGIGFPQDTQAGFGLQSMRQRAVQLNGTLDCGPRPGGGTKVVLCLPVPAEEGDD